MARSGGVVHRKEGGPGAERPVTAAKSAVEFQRPPVAAEAEVERHHAREFQPTAESSENRVILPRYLLKPRPLAVWPEELRAIRRAFPAV